MGELCYTLDHQMLKNENNLHSQDHSKSLDKYLGYKISKIEVQLLKKYRAYDRRNDDSSRKQHYKGTQTWIGLHPQALQTPYCEIYSALSLLGHSDIRHVVDVGAGYGRVGIVLNVLYPHAKFTGYEIVEKRQLEGNRIYTKYGLDNCNIILKNVLDIEFDLPKADVYFIYDFSDKDDIRYILQSLSQRVRSESFYLVIRGDRIDYLMKNKYKNVWRCNQRLETTDLKIYTSISA